MRTDYYKWIVPNYKHKSIKSSKLRFKIAQEEKWKKRAKRVELEEIIRIVNEFLVSMDMEEIQDPKVEFNAERNNAERLKRLREKGVFINLDNEKDIVWMKFTKNGYLGVVGTSTDINFDYDNTSGKIISSVGEYWDESFILVFPLIKSPQSRNELDRHLMESGIGNYLICHDVPILDFYSHNI